MKQTVLICTSIIIAMTTSSVFADGASSAFGPGNSAAAKGSFPNAQVNCIGDTRSTVAKRDQGVNFSQVLERGERTGNVIDPFTGEQIVRVSDINAFRNSLGAFIGVIGGGSLTCGDLVPPSPAP